MEKQLFNFGVPWEKDISFSQGAWVRGGRLVLLSGQAAIDDGGKVVGKGDMESQVRAALEAVRRGLALAGATPADVVKVVYYTTDCRAFHKTQPVREAFFSRPLSRPDPRGGHPPGHARLPGGGRRHRGGAGVRRPRRPREPARLVTRDSVGVSHWVT